MSQAALAQHNVIAAFRDLEYASDALGKLREAGFAESDLSILGRSPEDLEVVSEDETGEPMPGTVFKDVAAGSLGGGGIGAVLGALGGAAAALIPGVGIVVGTGAVIGAISGGGLGGTVGAIVEGEASMRSDASWDQTFDAMKTGAVVVGAHHDDESRIREAEAVMAELDPMQIKRVNDRGQEVVVTDDHEDAGDDERGTTGDE